jgi:tetratricopeptide (TPR) repeat protein
MKKYSFLIFILFSFISQAENENALLDEANKQYTAGNFVKAAEGYEQILASGKESAQLYFNLGNTYFKNGDKIKAILNYERAKLLAPQNEDIDFNLKVANQFVVDNIEQLPKPFFSRWWSSIANISSADGWAKKSVLGFLIFLVLLGSYFFSRSMRLRKLAFYTAVLTGIFVVLSFTLAAKQYRFIRNRQSALIQCPRVTVKSSPTATGTDLFLIHEGLKVEITDKLDKWREIQLADGNKGWVADSCLVKI